MARRKNYYSFLDFNYTEGAIDLFHNTIRQAFEYDSLTDDVFQARVLTEPTPIVDAATQLSAASVLGDKNQKYSFRVRILGENSPHRFLEDPCLLEDADEDISANLVFSIIQNHTQVFLYDDSSERKPKIGDTVNIKLSRSGNSYNTRVASQYIGIAGDVDGVDVKTVRADCSSLAVLFDGADFNELSSHSSGEESSTGKYPAIDGPEVERVYQLWLTMVTPKDRELLEKCGGTAGYDSKTCAEETIDGQLVRLHPDFLQKAKQAVAQTKQNNGGETIKFGSSKRTPREQIRLRLGNATKELSDEEILTLRRAPMRWPTATVPTKFGSGGSRHLYGLAIDFTGDLQTGGLKEAVMPGSAARQTKTWKYMRDNIKIDGFKHYRGGPDDKLEPWHWSADGG